MINGGKSKILVTCPKGLADFLKGELVALGLPIISEVPSGVETEGGLVDAMRINLHVRTGQRVMFFLGEFPSADIDGLYRGMREIRWEDYIHADGYLCVTSAVENRTIRDSRIANLKAKDAVVDRIREKTGRRPDSGPRKDGAVLFLYWRGERCSVYFDTSGEPLHKRNYRKIPLKAPMQETLAAAVVAASGWTGNGHFINPMCGSGTLSIEAALIALNRAPGMLRNNFGFMHVKGFNGTEWETLRNEAAAAARSSFSGRIVASDRDGAAIKAARENASNAGVDRLIEFVTCDFRETEVPAGGGVVLFNPEYGARLGDGKNLEGTYKEIGDFLKRKCAGYKGYIFTGNLSSAKKNRPQDKEKDPFF